MSTPNELWSMILAPPHGDAARWGMTGSRVAEMRVEAKLEILPGASHLFEGLDTVDAVARLARDCFARLLGWTDRLC